MRNTKLIHGQNQALQHEFKGAEGMQDDIVVGSVERVRVAIVGDAGMKRATLVHRKARKSSCSSLGEARMQGISSIRAKYFTTIHRKEPVHDADHVFAREGTLVFLLAKDFRNQHGMCDPFGCI